MIVVVYSSDSPKPYNVWISSPYVESVGEPVNSASKRECGEVEEFYTLLNSTLHNECVVDSDVIEKEGSKLQPGRLQERIAALRKYKIN